MSIKGFSSDQKLGDQSYLTLQNISGGKTAADMLPKAVYSIQEANFIPDGGTVSSIELAGHVAQIGDMIRFVEGDHKGIELTVSDISANEIFFDHKLPTAVIAADEFKILKYLTLTIAEDGSLQTSQGPLQILKDAAIVQIQKDTVDPNNTIALPVEIVAVDGTEINITAGDINVQISHTGANPDSVRIGDGVELLDINVDNEALVHDQDTHDKLDLIYDKMDKGLLDAGNSTTIPLGIGGVFTGTAIEVVDYASLNVNIFTDQDAAVNGLQIQSSTDGVNWDHTHTVNVTANVGAGFSFPVEFRYMRVRLTNGAVAQTVLRLQTILKKENLHPSRYTVDQGITGNQHAIVTSTVIHGKTTAGGSSYIPVKVTPSGSLATDMTSDQLPTTLGQKANADSFAVTLSTEQEALLTSIDGKDFATETTLAALAAEDFATEATLALLNAKDFATETTLAALAAEDFATETTLALLNAKDFATETTLAALAAEDFATETTLALLNGKDFATETTLASVLAKIIAAPATEAKQDTIITELITIKNNTTALDVVETVAPISINANNIPAVGDATGLELVASTASDIKKIQTIEDVGEYLGLYSGAIGALVLECILPIAGGSVDVSIPSGTRLTIKHLKASAISSDTYFAANLLG